jgi:hypothetical protein
MNGATTPEEPMAKKAGRPSKPEGRGKPVRVHPDVARMAQRIADYRGLALSDFLSDLVRPAVTREYQKMSAEIDAKEAKR